ncbi:MAG: replication-relaxation family protein [Candidatus Zixiibacteriota bacterium]
MRRAKPFTPNDRDREILWLTYEYRYVSVDLLHALLQEPPKEGRSYGFGLSGLRARCQKLREHGYLVWQHLRDEPVGRGHRTERPMVYAVGPAAADVLAERTGLTPRQFKAVLAKNAVTSFFLRHELGISHFRACLELACRGTESKVSIGTWLQGGLNDRVIVDVDGKEEIVPVVPDALFSLIVRTANGRTTLSHYFLEYDTGTMDLKRISKKAFGYERYLSEGLHRRRYTYAGDTADTANLRFVVENWNDIKAANRAAIEAHAPLTFQVLFVTRASPEDLRRSGAGDDPARVRQRNMMDAVREVSDSRGRFLFCTAEVDFDLQQVTTILDSAWLSTASADARRKLLDLAS